MRRKLEISFSQKDSHDSKGKGGRRIVHSFNFFLPTFYFISVQFLHLPLLFANYVPLFFPKAIGPIAQLVRAFDS